MKSIINMLQDSNFQAQIDSIMLRVEERVQELLERRNLNLPSRFSMPNEVQTGRSSGAGTSAALDMRTGLKEDATAEEFSVQKKNPRKKAQAVSSVRPRASAQKKAPDVAKEAESIQELSE